MTTYTTRTKELGTCVFTAPAARDDYAGYVFVETDRGYASKERRQICYGGDFRGSTVTASAGALKYEAQRWLRQRRAWRRADGIIEGED